MAASAGNAFLRGLVTGVSLSLLVWALLLYLLVDLGLIGNAAATGTGWLTAVSWLDRNLGLSLLPFTLVLLLYLQTLRRLTVQLHEQQPLYRITQGLQLLDVWISLFFGIGVIWTAIGMRSALLHALGDTGAVAQAGAFAVLQRLVDGGILTALSTTIVGGAGGYLMRLVKSATVGARISRYYNDYEWQRHERVCRLLGEIRDGHRLLTNLTTRSSE
jgi:hypothetical protein